MVKSKALRRRFRIRTKRMESDGDRRLHAMAAGYLIVFANNRALVSLVVVRSTSNRGIRRQIFLILRTSEMITIRGND